MVALTGVFYRTKRLTSYQKRDFALERGDHFLLKNIYPFSLRTAHAGRYEFSSLALFLDFPGSLKAILFQGIGMPEKFR
ncbi:MAG: hypothetical protein KDD12_13100 [Lewinella sp.]|nr:hypothetical protein [Lewinella sp.]